MRRAGASRLTSSVISASASCAALLTVAAADASVLRYADAVVQVSYGGGRQHPNFSNPQSVLGMTDYSGGPFGTGAYSLGTGGSIVVRMAVPFRGSGDGQPDLVISEIGPSEGGSAEGTAIEVSADATTWTSVGSLSGGVGSIDLDAHGIGDAASMRFVRIVDLSFNPGVPAGADVDSVKAAFFSPDLNSDGTVDALDLAILLGAWGQAGIGDLDDSGAVDAVDLSVLLGAWG